MTARKLTSCLLLIAASLLLTQCDQQARQCPYSQDSQPAVEVSQSSQDSTNQEGAMTNNTGEAARQRKLDEPVYIVPIGDSITHGGRLADEYSWRYPLFKMLTDAGVEFDFVGAYEKGLKKQFQWPDVDGKPFDPDHQAAYGIKTAKMRNRIVEDRKKWSHAPDIALIHLGTNDQKGGNWDETVVKPLADMIEMLREENPEVIVFLGHLNFKEGAAAKIRPMVEQLAKDKTTEKSPVHTVHHYEGFNANPQGPDTDTYDWAHPNPKGQEKMARKWFEAMLPYLPIDEN
jgi:sulfur relay (sulfurtransferase) DsrC/TusE family protein